MQQAERLLQQMESLSQIPGSASAFGMTSGTQQQPEAHQSLSPGGSAEEHTDALGNNPGGTGISSSNVIGPWDQTVIIPPRPSASPALAMSEILHSQAIEERARKTAEAWKAARAKQAAERHLAAADAVAATVQTAHAVAAMVQGSNAVGATVQAGAARTQPPAVTAAAGGGIPGDAQSGAVISSSSAAGASQPLPTTTSQASAGAAAVPQQPAAIQLSALQGSLSVGTLQGQLALALAQALGVAHSSTVPQIVLATPAVQAVQPAAAVRSASAGNSQTSTEAQVASQAQQSISTNTSSVPPSNSTALPVPVVPIQIFCNSLSLDQPAAHQPAQAAPAAPAGITTAPGITATAGMAATLPAPVSGASPHDAVLQSPVKKRYSRALQDSGTEVVVELVPPVVVLPSSLSVPAAIAAAPEAPLMQPVEVGVSKPAAAAGDELSGGHEAQHSVATAVTASQPTTQAYAATQQQHHNHQQEVVHPTQPSLPPPPPPEAPLNPKAVLAQELAALILSAYEEDEGQQGGATHAGSNASGTGIASGQYFPAASTTAQQYLSAASTTAQALQPLRPPGSFLLTEKLYSTGSSGHTQGVHPLPPTRQFLHVEDQQQPSLPGILPNPSIPRGTPAPGFLQVMDIVALPLPPPPTTTQFALPAVSHVPDPLHNTQLQHYGQHAPTAFTATAAQSALAAAAAGGGLPVQGTAYGTAGGIATAVQHQGSTSTAGGQYIIRQVLSPLPPATVRATGVPVQGPVPAGAATAELLSPDRNNRLSSGAPYTGQGARHTSHHHTVTTVRAVTTAAAEASARAGAGTGTAGPSSAGDGVVQTQALSAADMRRKATVRGTFLLHCTLLISSLLIRPSPAARHVSYIEDSIYTGAFLVMAWLELRKHAPDTVVDSQVCNLRAHRLTHGQQR
jgi:hypothetical protein